MKNKATKIGDVTCQATIDKKAELVVGGLYVIAATADVVTIGIRYPVQRGLRLPNGEVLEIAQCDITEIPRSTWDALVAHVANVITPMPTPKGT